MSQALTAREEALAIVTGQTMVQPKCPVCRQSRFQLPPNDLPGLECVWCGAWSLLLEPVDP